MPSKNFKKNTTTTLAGNCIAIGCIVIYVLISLNIVRMLCFFRVKLHSSSDLIFVTSGEVPTGVAPISFLMFFIALFCVISICIGKTKISEVCLRIKQRINLKKGKIRFLACIIVYILIIFGFIDTFIDYSIIYEGRIFNRNAAYIWGKYYNYSDIKEVTADERKDYLYYDLIMKDGTTIDLTSIKSNYRYVPEVELHISNNVPHLLYNRNILYEYHFPDYISKRFKIAD